MASGDHFWALFRVSPPPNDPPFTLGGRFHIPAAATSVGEAYRAAAQGTAPSSPAFYRAFWRMQYLMTHPATVLATSDTWALYVCSMRAVLRAFEREDEESGVAVSLGGQGVMVNSSSSSSNPPMPASHAHLQQQHTVGAAVRPLLLTASSSSSSSSGALSPTHAHHQPSLPSHKPMAVEEGEEGEEVAPGALTKGRLATATTAALPPPPPAAATKPGAVVAPAPLSSAAATALAAA